MYRLRFLPLLLIVLTLSACGSTKRPVLYPNHYLNSVGMAAAQADIDHCMQLAYDSGANEGRGGTLLKDTAKAGAVGAATGAVVGAVKSSSNIGRGAAIGSAGAATARLVSGAFSVSDPTPIFKRFVDQCLVDSGYKVLGWR